MAQRETVIAWLNDAYGTEQNLIQVLKNHVEDAADSPVLQSRLQSHLDETRRHADLVRDCVERLGGKVSATKSMMGSVSGFFQGMAGSGADDQLIKDLLSDYAMENFEIACYRSLVAAAEAIGETEVADTCREILREEEQMAQWIERQLPTSVTQYVHRAAA